MRQGGGKFGNDLGDHAAEQMEGLIACLVHSANDGGMVVAHRRAHLAGREVQNLASGIVDHDAALGAAEEVGEGIAAVAD